MPPRSRGSTKGNRRNVNVAEKQGKRGENRRENLDRSSTMTTGRRAGRDPLTAIVALIAYPLLLAALTLLHVVYYASFKAKSNVRYFFASLKALRNESGVRNKVNALFRLSSTAERHAERRLRAMAEANELIDVHHHDSVAAIKAAGRGSKIVRMPRHVGLAIGSKPMRWRSLIWRSSLDKLWGRQERDDYTKSLKRQQHTFIIENIKSSLRCCQLARIEELTVYDELGFLVQCHANGQLQALIDDEVASDVQINVHRTASEQTSKRSTTKTHTPNQRTIVLHLLGPQDAKQAIANAANALLKHTLSDPINDLAIDEVLRRSAYPREPDLLILHGGSRQVSTLHGFPPWLVRLCEVFHDRDATSYERLTILSFEKAIGRYMRSEQRYGK